MNVRIAVLADFASITNDNKLNILGVFTDLFATKVPAVHPQMQLVTVLEFDSTEAGDKDLKLVLVDEDGREVFSISGILRVERGSAGRQVITHQIFNFNNLTFPKYGEYEFVILINGDRKGSVSLRVREPSSEDEQPE